MTKRDALIALLARWMQFREPQGQVFLFRKWMREARDEQIQKRRKKFMRAWTAFDYPTAGIYRVQQRGHS